MYASTAAEWSSAEIAAGSSSTAVCRPLSFGNKGNEEGSDLAGKRGGRTGTAVSTGFSFAAFRNASWTRLMNFLCLAHVITRYRPDHHGQSNYGCGCPTHPHHLLAPLHDNVVFEQWNTS